MEEFCYSKFSKMFQRMSQIFTQTIFVLSKIVHIVNKNVTQHNFTRIHIVNRVLIISGSTHSRQNVSIS